MTPESTQLIDAWWAGDSGLSPFTSSSSYFHSPLSYCVPGSSPAGLYFCVNLANSDLPSQGEPRLVPRGQPCTPGPVLLRPSAGDRGPEESTALSLLVLLGAVPMHDPAVRGRG